MSVKRVLGRNMVWNMAGLSVDNLAGFVIMPFLIHRLGDTTYGIWIVLGSLTGYLGLLDIGVRSSLGRHVALHHSQGNPAALNGTLTAAVAVLVLVGLAAILAGQLFGHLFFKAFDVSPDKHGEAADALQIVTVQFAIFMLSSAFDATLWGFQRFDRINLVDIAAAIARTGLVFALVRTEHDLIVVAWIILGVTAASAFAKAWLCFRFDPLLRIGAGHLNSASLRELIGFGKWNLIIIAARITRRQLGPLLIGSMLGLALVAPFSVADRLLGLVGAVLIALTGVLLPYSTALHATDQPDRLRKVFLDGGRYCCVLSSCLIGFLLAMGGPLIVLFIGSPLGSAALILTILALGELLPSSQHVTFGILQATARHRALSVLALIDMIAVVLSAIILIPLFGLVGAALAIACPGALTRGIAPMIHGCRVVGLPFRQYLTKAILPTLLVAAIPAIALGFAVDYHSPTTWVLFLGYGIGYLAIFGGCYAGYSKLILISRLLRPEILVLGDSHASVFNHLLFRELFPKSYINVIAVGGATASGLDNPNSITQAYPTFRSALRLSRARTIIVILGEVDTGFVIWYRALKYQESLDLMLRQAVNNFSNFLIEIPPGREIICISTPLPTIQDNNDWGMVANARKEIVATQMERTNLTLVFNEKMREFCAANGITYVMLDQLSLGDDGLVKKELLNIDTNDHHYQMDVYAKMLVNEIKSVLTSKSASR